MSAKNWKQHRIQVRARELLQEHPPRDIVPFGIMVRDVIAIRREMNRLKRRRYR